MSEQEQAKEVIEEEQEIQEKTVGPEKTEEAAEAADTEAETASAGDSAYDELNKRYLRLLADFDNFKRRTANEKDDIYKYGNINLVKELLPVLDSFELAFKNAPADAAENIAAYQEGFAKVQKQLVEALSKAGLERIEAIGEEYDPNFHEAIMVVDDDSQPANTVFDELRAGYKFNDRVIRPTVCRVTGNK